MMISVKKVFISSNSRIICLPCPLPRGRFLIQESAVGGLSYYIKKEQLRKAIPHFLYYAFFFCEKSAAVCFFCENFIKVTNASIITIPAGSAIHALCTNPATI